MATKLSLKELAAAAVEFNKVLGPKPPINVKGDEESLTEELIECLDLINPEEDTFTKGTQKVIDTLSAGKESSDEEEEEEEEEEKPAKGKKSAAPVKGKKPAPVEEDEDDEEDEDEEEEEVPAPKKGKAPLKVVKGGKKPAPVEDDEDEDDEEEEEEIPAPKKGKTPVPAPAKKKVVVEEDDDDDDEEVPAPKKGKLVPAPVKGKKPAPVVEEEDDEDDDDAEENLYDTVKNAKSKADLLELIEAEDVFKKKRKTLKEIKSIFSLKAEMLKLVPKPEVDEDDEEEEEEKPAPKKSVAKPAAKPAPKKKVVVEEDDDEEEEEEEEEVSPAMKVLEVVKAAKERKTIIAVVKAHPDMFEGFKTKKYEELKALKAAIATLLSKQASKPAPKAAPAKGKPAAKKESGGAFTKVGIQETCYKAVQEAGEVGISYDGIMKKLVKKFPERDPQAMRRTLGVAVPSRMEKQMGVKIERLENGKWRIKVKKAKR